jgi:stalled ribosome rescue protein Dom34
MPTFHAVVWLDHREAHVLMFDRKHVELESIKSRSHHKHQGIPHESNVFFDDVSKALIGTHEVLLTGPGTARNEFRHWCEKHHLPLSNIIVDSIASDHPTDAQVVAMARQYFKKLI